MITQFQGESRRDAIVNHFSLDLEEEESFFDYIERMGYSEDADDDSIRGLYNMWREAQ